MARICPVCTFAGVAEDAQQCPSCGAMLVRSGKKRKSKVSTFRPENQADDSTDDFSSSFNFDSMTERDSQSDDSQQEPEPATVVSDYAQENSSGDEIRSVSLYDIMKQEQTSMLVNDAEAEAEKTRQEEERIRNERIERERIAREQEELAKKQREEERLKREAEAEAERKRLEAENIRRLEEERIAIAKRQAEEEQRRREQLRKEEEARIAEEKRVLKEREEEERRREEEERRKAEEERIKRERIAQEEYERKRKELEEEESRKRAEEAARLEAERIAAEVARKAAENGFNTSFTGEAYNSTPETSKPDLGASESATGSTYTEVIQDNVRMVVDNATGEVVSESPATQEDARQNKNGKSKNRHRASTGSKPTAGNAKFPQDVKNSSPKPVSKPAPSADSPVGSSEHVQKPETTVSSSQDKNKQRNTETAPEHKPEVDAQEQKNSPDICPEPAKEPTEEQPRVPARNAKTATKVSSDDDDDDLSVDNALLAFIHRIIDTPNLDRKEEKECETNLNEDGYYNDVKSDIPPKADKTPVSVIVQRVFWVVLFTAFVIFMIFYV